MSEPQNDAKEATATESTPTFREMSRIQAMGLRMWGPADSHDNPLYGTKYDPILRQQRQHESLVYRRERWERRKARFRDMAQRISARTPHMHVHGRA